MKQKRLVTTVVLAVLLVGVFLLFRYGLPTLYTPEWTARQIFWPVAAVILLPALWGKVRFSVSAFAGYLAGVAAGELFGGWEADVGPQYLHWGWLIAIGVFLGACLLGVLLEKGKNQKT